MCVNNLAYVEYGTHLPVSLNSKSKHELQALETCTCAFKVKNLWTNGKICAKVAFPRYMKSVKFKSQSRETVSKRKPCGGPGTR